jgi:multidrug resistance efflux pump
MLVLQEVAPPGIQVRKGQTVAEFDRQYMLLRLDDYKASVAQAEAALAKSKANMAVARKIKEQDITTAKAAVEKARLDVKTTPVLSAIDAERAKLALSEGAW